MAGSKRERELARAKYERQQARRAQRVDRRRRNQRIVAVIVVIGLVLGSVAWVVLATRSGDEVAAQPTPSIDPSAFASLVASAEAAARASESASPTPSGSASPSVTEAPVEEPAILDCTAPGTPRGAGLSFPSAPTDRTASSITFTTNCGPIVVALDPAAPQTVSSAVFLTEEGFYDDTSCHRLTTAGIFVLQCGDPLGDGTGGPGYVVPDENLPADGEANYPAGTVAMANAGPGTAGSQFFIVYEDTTLPGDYTIFGQVTEGLDIVREVASVGTVDGGADGQPRQPVFIESATVQP
jgi:peptidyl-prolyl cis-trans isomerase B (cyclophilin B)